MIPKRYIQEWSTEAPWKIPEYIEQDLIISRALIVLFSDNYLKANLAFRGGTALHKLYLNPAARYSEDIDLVQIKEGPIIHFKGLKAFEASFGSAADICGDNGGEDVEPDDPGF